MKSSTKYGTAAAAKRLGVSKSTLLRWLVSGKVADVGRDRHGWRMFTSSDLARIRKEMGLSA